MKAAPLWRVSVAIAEEAEEAVGELLMQVFGEAAAIYTDIETKAIQASVYPATRVTLRKIAALRKGLERIKACGIDAGPRKISVRRVRREEWAESWKRHFKPITIGDSLLIRPSWSRRRPRKTQGEVVLDPGLSFGTGQHPTTFFCLEQLVACKGARASQAFLDLGTGSGILAIAAAKLGYTPVLAVDVDPTAIRIAKGNAKQNGVAIQIIEQDLSSLRLGKQKFEVICANLTFDLLLAEQSRILRHLRSRGTLVLAGILNDQFPFVEQAYLKAGLELLDQKSSGEWTSGAFR